METCKHCGANKTCAKCSGNLALGLLAGVAIGAAIAMLFTPQKGTVLQKAIRRKGEDIVDEVAESVEDRISQFGNIVTGKIDSLKDDLISRFGSVVESIKNG